VREALLRDHYDPYAAALEHCVQQVLTRFGRALIIDAHSYPRAPLPWEQVRGGSRPDVDLGTDRYHTPADLTALLRSEVITSGYTVAVDSPFSGTYVPMAFYRRERKVTSVMLEIRRDVYRGPPAAGWRKAEAMIARLVKRAHDWVLESE
jgi:N-formylglutamate deformylase